MPSVRICRMHMPLAHVLSSKSQTHISIYFSATKKTRHKVTNSAHNITNSAHKVRNKSANYYFCFGDVRKGCKNTTMKVGNDFNKTGV